MAGVRHECLRDLRGEIADDQERALRALAETGVAIWEIDSDGRTTFVNSAAARMLGYRPAELHGRHLIDLMDRDGAATTTLYLDRRRRGLRDTRQVRMRHRDGRDVWLVVSAAPLWDDAGRYAGATAVLIEISKRGQLGSALLSAGTIAEKPRRATWTVDLATGAVEWSDEMYVMFAVDPTTFSPSYANAMALIHEADRVSVQRAFEVALVKRLPFSAFFRVAGADGRVRVLHARGATDGGGARISGVMRDVTEVMERQTVSRREREVLDLMAHGMTAAEIADRLQISPETVRTHMQNAIRKLNARNRLHAVVLAITSGELDL